MEDNKLFQRPQEDTSMLSDEHSYCASSAGLLSISEEQLRDVTFGGSGSQQQLGQMLSSGARSSPARSGGSSPALGGLSMDISCDHMNFDVDGFNFSVPVPDADFESVWLSPIDGTVEIAAGNNEVANGGDGGDKGRAGDGKDGGDDAQKTNGRKYARPRRRDYIEDPGARGRFFEDKFNKLALHLHRAMKRTKCEGELSAKYDGIVFDTALSKNQELNTSLIMMSASLRKSQLGLQEKDQWIGREGQVDDHRYAATMLTQKVSSPAVKDHQYDEKTIMMTDEFESDEEESNGKKKRRKTENRFDYIKVGWKRNQTFSKFAKSLFMQKAVIEGRSGATVSLKMEYEGCCITEDNYQDALNIILTSKKSRRVKPARLAPRQVGTPLTFFIPNIAPLAIPIQYSLPMTSATVVPNESIVSVVGNSENLETIQTTACDGDVNVFNINEVIRDASTALGDFPEEHHSSLEENTSTSRPISPTNTANPTSGSIRSSLSDIGEILMLPQSSGQPSPEPEPNLTSSRGTKEFSTNTEPVCSICLNEKTSNISDRAEHFWIRCNDPFCYDMVHASCVGFVVTCSSHLKQLPAFYCKVHR